MPYPTESQARAMIAKAVENVRKRHTSWALDIPYPSFDPEKDFDELLVGIITGKFKTVDDMPSWEANHEATLPCLHSKVATPIFDEERAQREKMSSDDIRREFPRTDEICPDCDQRVIRYASDDHHILGDW